VISLQLGFRTLQAALYRKLFPNTRLIIWMGLSEHTEKGLPRWRILQRKALLALADAVLVNGASGMNYLIQLGVPRDKIFPLPYCPEIARFLAVPLDRGHSSKRLLNVGQLTVRKGLGPFLAVLSRWLREHPNQTCEFWLAGDGALREELEKFSATPRLQLRFLGNVAYDDLPDLYAKADVFVFPTLADEWGVVVNEALASGLPVLGSLYSQAVEELVEDGVNGWTFRPDREEEIYASLDRAMTASDRQIDEMGCSGRKKIRSLSPQFGADCYFAAIDFVQSSRDNRLLPRDEPRASSESSRKAEAPRL
jgi:glycosyltransferase involved in cell wall biosynthesis